MFLFIVIAIFIGFVFATQADRDYSSWSMKWYLSAFALVVALTHPHLAFIEASKPDQIVLLDFVQSQIFWVTILQYLAIGVVYSFLEMFLELQRFKEICMVEWAKFLKGRSVNTLSTTNDKNIVDNFKTNWDVLNAAKMKDELDPGKFQLDVIGNLQRAAIQILENYNPRYDISEWMHIQEYMLFTTELDRKNFTIQPKLRTSRVIAYFSAWILFWPFYLVGLIIGDVVIRALKALSNLLASVATKIMRRVFANVFKI